MIIMPTLFVAMVTFSVLLELFEQGTTSEDMHRNHNNALYEAGFDALEDNPLYEWEADTF